MKTKFFLILPLLMVAGFFAFGQDTDTGLTSSQLMNYMGYGAIVFTLILFIIVMLVLLRTFKIMTRIVLGPKAYAELLAEDAEKKAEKKVKRQAEKGQRMLKLLSLKPMSEEKSLLIDHEYDGIQELNNPTPAWFMYLFYITIIFAVGYLLVYHVFGVGQLQYDEYKTEMAVAAKEKEAYLAKAANRVDETTVKLTTDPAVLASGQAIFKDRCSPCHGDHAQGVVGPNLTDDYWLHGGKINEVFKTIKYGVSAKGMPTWEKQLSPKQISDVANYVKSLKGSNPANPKAPQGDKESDDAKPEAKVAALTK